ncbi:reverse transcriptase domain-containing protein [Tanacetum coccineum]
MAERDKDKTAFFAGERVFCYQKMPFGLKNAGATYQRLVDKVFHDQIGRNLEPYVDDMVIKSTSEEDMLAHIKEAFESRVLQGAEINYPSLEKLILALALTKPEKSGQVAKWVIELGEHDIIFQKRGDDKKEVPKDFLIKVPLEDIRKEAEGRTDTKFKNTKLSCEWKLYTDGAASSDGSGTGLMLIDPEGKEYTYALHFEFETTNNKAEYEALLAGL